MAIDIGRVVQAGIQAATQELTPQNHPRKPRLSTAKAVLVGAGLMTAGRLLAGPKGRELLGSVQGRLAGFDEYREDEEPEAEEDYDDEDYEDEPEGEAEEDYDDEDYEDEPEGEAEEDYDDEDYEDEPEGEAEDEYDDEDYDDEPEEETDEDSPRPRRGPRTRERGRS